MPGVGHSLGSGSSSLRNDVLTVPKKELDLQKSDSWVLPLHASYGSAVLNLGSGCMVQQTMPARR